MGWLGDNLARFVKGLVGAPPLELTFVQSVPAPGIPGIGESVQPDSCYIELYLESLRPSRARVFATRFHGVVYSFVKMAREGEESAELAAIAKPDKLTDIDKNAVDRVITVSKQMMGATPFRGNPVSLQLGLFSVKAGNVLTPVLDYVAKVSTTAGISYVGAVKPFLPLITEGMDLIAGQQPDTALEVGVDTDLTLSAGQVAAIIARPKGSIDATKLSLDQDRRLLLDGKPLESGYAVFSLRPRPDNPGFGGIPELKQAYAAFVAACKARDKAKAEATLAAFQATALLSPDLIPSDAKRLFEKARQVFSTVFPPGAGAALRAAVRLGDLSEIGLYDSGPGPS